MYILQVFLWFLRWNGLFTIKINKHCLSFGDIPTGLSSRWLSFRLSCHLCEESAEPRSGLRFKVIAAVIDCIQLVNVLLINIL